MRAGVWVCAKPLHSCLTPCDPMDCSARLFCSWVSPGKNTGMGCEALLQGMFLKQDLNLHLLQLLHCRQILYCRATREASGRGEAEPKLLVSR